MRVKRISNRIRSPVPPGGEALTQRETAQHCGISRSYVSRIEKKAIEKLRAALQADGY